jgi:hypothetical protein
MIYLRRAVSRLMVRVNQISLELAEYHVREMDNEEVWRRFQEFARMGSLHAGTEFRLSRVTCSDAADGLCIGVEQRARASRSAPQVFGPVDVAVAVGARPPEIRTSEVPDGRDGGTQTLPSDGRSPYVPPQGGGGGGAAVVFAVASRV